MENLIELNNEELKNLNGGATFAYRVGQTIRYSIFALNPTFGPEVSYYLVYWQ